MGNKPGRVRFFQGLEITKDVDFCDPSLNLLAHAQTVELEIGSRCGGHGECGRDRLIVRAAPGAVSPLTHAEKKHLSSEEVARGFRLGCQCWPERDDLVIECEFGV